MGLFMRLLFFLLVAYSSCALAQRQSVNENFLDNAIPFEQRFSDEGDDSYQQWLLEHEEGSWLMESINEAIEIGLTINHLRKWQEVAIEKVMQLKERVEAGDFDACKMVSDLSVCITRLREQINAPVDEGTEQDIPVQALIYLAIRTYGQYDETTF